MKYSCWIKSSSIQSRLSSSIIWSVTILFHSLSVVWYAVFSDKNHWSGFFLATSRSFHQWFFHRGVNTNQANQPLSFRIGRSKSHHRGSEIGYSEKRQPTGFVPTMLSIFLSVQITCINDPFISSSCIDWSFFFLRSAFGIWSSIVRPSLSILSQNALRHCSYSGKI